MVAVRHCYGFQKEMLFFVFCFFFSCGILLDCQKELRVKPRVCIFFCLSSALGTGLKSKPKGGTGSPVLLMKFLRFQKERSLRGRMEINAVCWLSLLVM